MAVPTLTPSLWALRDSFNRAFPNRDKASDGWIGDYAHSTGKSGHNPDDWHIPAGGSAEYQDADSTPDVRAIDVDGDLRKPGVTMLAVIRSILGDPNALKRLRYIIYNRVIWSRTTGWQPHAYTGSNPHDKHAHFSGDPADDDNGRAWPAVLKFLVEDDMTPAESATLAAIARDVAQIKEDAAAAKKNADAASLRSQGTNLLTDVTTSWSGKNPTDVEENVLRAALEQIHAAVLAVGAPAPVDPAALQAAVQAVMLTPAFIQALAEAYAVENARRLAD